MPRSRIPRPTRSPAQAPPRSRSGGIALPPPTASEAAFERLLAGFDADDGPDVVEDEQFLAQLFSKTAEYNERDRFAGIGDADSFFTKIAGVTFEGRQNLVGGLVAGQTLELERRPDHPDDPNAIAVRFGHLHLGYLRREIARRLAPNFDRGDRYTASVASVTGGGARNIGVNIHVRRRRSAPVAPAEPFARARDATSDELRVALIGERAFREPQAAVLSLVAERRSTLAILGTGRGKSVCFQLPAAERALSSGEKTLVFYPLRALANDQYDALTKRLGRFGVRILRANGAIDGGERSALDDALEDGSWDVILATPEFASYHREAFERSCNRPNFIVIDEAHHVHESRHRHAYGTLGELIAALGAPPVLALTATAGEETFREIRRALRIDAWVIDPTVRENLDVVDARNVSEKPAYLMRELAADTKAIVYCNSRQEATTLAERLRAGFGDVVAFYHAGVPGAERARVEELFRSSRVRIVVATSAFGEGIDLPDVRDIVLYHLNMNFTQFNQMAGRAGRDGRDARIHLLYGDADRRINDFILARQAPTLETLREIYRGMRGLTRSDTLRLSASDVAETLAIDKVNDRTVTVAVRIFSEAGLVEAGTDDDGRYVRFLEMTGKVDLTATARYAEAVAEREAFERFCGLALTADAQTLRAVINRPIYPDRVPLRSD